MAAVGKVDVKVDVAFAGLSEEQNARAVALGIARQTMITSPGGLMSGSTLPGVADLIALADYIVSGIPALNTWKVIAGDPSKIEISAADQDTLL